jgi:uncharacterized protein (TIGR02001 family)
MPISVGRTAFTALLGFFISIVRAEAMDWGHFYVLLAATSDDRYYGFSRSDRKPMIQGDLHWQMPDDFYLGIFGTGARYRDGRNTSYELDFYGGKHFEIDGSDLNLGLLYATFPNSTGYADYVGPYYIFPTYNFVEGSAELSHTFGKLTVSGKLVTSPAYSSGVGPMWDVDGAVKYALTNWLSIGGGAGHQWMERIPNRTHWDFGATATWLTDFGRWQFDLRYHATDVSIADCYNTNWCAPAVVGTITYAFGG